jgi:predicted transposase YbfD/YdcC
MTYSTALALTLSVLNSDQRDQLLHPHPLLSLYEVFARLPDPRSRHGLRYEVAYLLTCLVAGLLCQVDSTLALAQWCRDHHEVLKQVFGPRRFLCPSDSLSRKLLPRLDAQQLEWALADWIASTLVAGPEDPIALDGKTLRGARSSQQAAAHLLSFRTHHSQETLLQVAVSAKTNEIPVAQALLARLPLAGRVCTADALHTQKQFMQAVAQAAGTCVLTVKNNQPTLYADLAPSFADPHACLVQDDTLDLHRGRLEKRSLRVSTEMNAYLQDWPLVEQVAELTRTVTVRATGKTSHEVVYLLTSLTPAQATPARLLALVRGHRSIENGSHYVRDVTFAEDRSRLRTGSAPHILAALRNLAITLIHRSGSSQIAATRRHFASHPRLAFDLLLPSSFSFP